MSADTSLILYQFPGGDGLGSISPPCLKVEMALRLIGEPFRRVDCRSRGEAQRVSRTGRLPVLEIDGERVADSIDILDALERRFPDRGLHPTEPEERVRDRVWEHFGNDHLYYMGFYFRWIADEYRERFLTALFRNAPFYQRWIAPPMLRRQSRARAHAIGIGGKSPEQVHATFERAMEMIETGLAGGPFLQGRESPGRGDLACAALVAQAGFRGTLPDVEKRLRSHPLILEHTRRVFAACSMEPPAWLRD